MAINPSIAMGVQPLQLPDPVNQLARVMQIRGMQDEQAMNALKTQEYQRGVERSNRLTSLLAGHNGTPEELEGSLVRGGFLEEAGKLSKHRLDAANTKSQIEERNLKMAHDRVNSWGNVMGFVRQNPTPQVAASAVQHLVQMGIIPAEQAQAALAGAGNDPQSIQQWATMGFQTALDAKSQLPTFQTRNTGGTTDTISSNPVTGEVKVANTVKNTQSPDNAATNARIAADAAASRAQSERHFREGQAGAVEYLTTPEGVIAVPKKLVPGQSPNGVPVTVNGQPVAGKPSAGMEKELTGINQQKAIIAGALQSVKDTPDAFGFTRGLATMAGPLSESVAGRFDTDQQRQARSYLFNNVSKVINERAGAAQSAQELARLRSFLPAETDNAEQIVSKLEAFQTYLGDLEAGTRGKPVAKPAGGGKGPAPGTVEDGHRFKGGNPADPKNWEKV